VTKGNPNKSLEKENNDSETQTKSLTDQVQPPTEESADINKELRNLREKSLESEKDQEETLQENDLHKKGKKTFDQDSLNAQKQKENLGREDEKDQQKSDD
jgi:hypothetical protein